MAADRGERSAAFLFRHGSHPVQATVLVGTVRNQFLQGTPLSCHKAWKDRGIQRRRSDDTKSLRKDCCTRAGIRGVFAHWSVCTGKDNACDPANGYSSADDTNGSGAGDTNGSGADDTNGSDAGDTNGSGTTDTDHSAAGNTDGSLAAHSNNSGAAHSDGCGADAISSSNGCADSQANSKTATDFNADAISSPNECADPNPNGDASSNGDIYTHANRDIDVYRSVEAYDDTYSRGPDTSTAVDGDEKQEHWGGYSHTGYTQFKGEDRRRRNVCERSAAGQFPQWDSHDASDRDERPDCHSGGAVFGCSRGTQATGGPGRDEHAGEGNAN